MAFFDSYLKLFTDFHFEALKQLLILFGAFYFSLEHQEQPLILLFISLLNLN